MEIAADTERLRARDAALGPYQKFMVRAKDVFEASLSSNNPLTGPGESDIDYAVRAALDADYTKDIVETLAALPDSDTDRLGEAAALFDRVEEAIVVSEPNTVNGKPRH